MPKEITLEDFCKRGYETGGISNYKLVECVCSECEKEFSYSSVKKFMRNRKHKLDKQALWNTCRDCWLSINTAKDPEWIRKNREAQLKIQSTPDQKMKNAIGVSKSWTEERRNKCSKMMKERWKDEEYAAKILKGLEWTQHNDERFRVNMAKSFGSGGHQGEYHSLNYDSLLELSFIIWCENNNIPIKRYDLPPVKYADELGKPRLYFPDFVIYDDVVVEIKGFGLYYRKNFERNIKKTEAAKEFFNDYRMIFETDKCIKTHYKLAKRLHHENKIKNTQAV